MRIAIGIDVGWSARQRTCALAIRGDVPVSRSRSFGPEVAVGLFTLEELLVELRRLAATHAAALQTAVLVLDGPVGPRIDAAPERRVDGEFGRGGFFNRAPAYLITQGSGLQLSITTSRILHTLAASIPVRPWLGGPLPEDGLVVAETNPTPAMALLLPQQEIDTLPSRSRRKYLGDAPITAKSDWYWRLGAGGYAARVLREPTIAEEENHERIAGLFSLALAATIADGGAGAPGVVALGDGNGVYVVPGDIDESWAPDVQRIGVAHGKPRFGRTPPAPAAAATLRGAQDLPVASSPPRDTATPTDERSQDAVTVVLNDNGGLNVRANPWLQQVDIPCCLQGPADASFTVVDAFDGTDQMYKIAPTALQLATRLGFNGAHLSKKSPVAFEATIVDAT